MRVGDEFWKDLVARQAMDFGKVLRWLEPGGFGEGDEGNVGKMLAIEKLRILEGCGRERVEGV